MTGAFFLGWRYLRFHRFKSLVLLASVTLMIFLPAATRLLVADSATALTARAQATPLLLGERGGELELVLNALYFHAEQPPALPYSALDDIEASGLADGIPLYTRFQTRGAPIVGTSLDYFEFRNRQLASGRLMGLLGEAVVGANVAREQGVGPGDHLVSSPETVFDLAGVYPLKMQVVGVLARSGSPDDDAVFVDVRTAWVIQGLGHGHEDLAGGGSSGSVLSRNEGTITANAALKQFNEITAENIRDFHFHGDTSGFPLSAIIIVPPNDKSATLLRGRFQNHESGYQVLVPGDVLNDLLETVFTIQNYVILGLMMLSLATIAVVTLVFLLSQQLRRGEFMTLKRMGASRGFVATLIASEIGFVLLGSLALSALMSWVTRHYATEFLLSLVAL
jgi:putative ABC transport system permease protein